MTIELLAGMMSAMLTVSPQAMPDPCTLISAAEIASALGGKPAPGIKEGPTRDEESKADSSSCMFGIGDRVLVVGLSEVGSDQAAAAALKEAQEVSKDADVGIPLNPQSGVGDQALWGITEGGATWVTRKGKYVLTLVVGGEEGDPSRLRGPLKRLIVSALSKL